MQVWILMQGEAEEGGDVLGVYADEKKALAEFMAKVRETGAKLSDCDTCNGEGRYAVSDSDWLSVEPHPVRT